jgi:hypothetical protein
VEVRVLAPRDSGGDALTLAVHLAHYASGTELRDRKTVTVDTRAAPTGERLGGLRIAPAGLATLALLLLGGALRLVLLVAAPDWRSRARGGFDRLVGPGAAVIALTVALGFWTLSATMAWRDWQALARWPETTCTVLGRRLAATGTTRSTGTGAGGTRRDDTVHAPVLGLRYPVNGRDMLSSGYDTGSSLGVGGRAGRQRELAAWTVGSTTPCWFDPDDPGDVVVRRGFGGAYLFALLPVPLFLLGAHRFRSLLTRR